MKKLIASLTAAGVLVSGAFVASVVSGADARAQTAADTTLDATTRPERPERGAILDEVLDGLVADGTLDQSQADAVVSALEAKRAELEERFGERPPRMGPHRRGVLRGLLADGVITADEIAALPEDHPLRNGEGPLAELLDDDGQITREELEAFRRERQAERRSEQEAGG